MPAPSLLNRRYLALLTVSFITSLVSAPLYTLLPVYVEADLLRTPLFSAGLRAIFIVLGGLFALPAGRFADSWGVKPIYLIGALGPALAGVVFITGDPLLLMALCVGIGISSGFHSAGGQSYLIGAAPASSIGVASAGYFLGNTLGAAAGNLFSGPIADHLGFQSLGVVAATAGLGLIAFTLMVLPGIPAPPASKQARTLAGFFELLRRPDMRLLMGIRFLPTCYWGAVTLLLPLLIFRISGSSTAATTFSAVSLGIAAMFQILTGYLCDRIGRWKPILVSSSLVVVSAVGLALTSQSLIGIYAFGILAAASAWSLSTTMPGLILLIARENERGRVVGATHLFWSLGMMSGTLGAGSLIQLGSAWPFGIGIAFCLGALACGFGLHRIHGPGGTSQHPGSTEQQES